MIDSPTTLHLIRHGEVEPRYHRVFGGSRIDMELSPDGHLQAARLAAYLRPTRFDAIYASPMRRAQQTLAPLAAQYAFPVKSLADLREVDFGDWTGLNWAQLKERFGVSASDWLEQMENARIPNGESARQFRDRVEPGLRRIMCECPGQTVAIVCHGGIVRMMLSILLDLPLPKLAHFEIEYGSLTVVECQPQRARVERLNFAPWRDLP